MNAFQKVAQAIGVTPDSQGDNAWLHSLLLVADGSGSDTFANPYTETVHRLRNINPHALARIKAMLADGEVQHAAGKR